MKPADGYEHVYYPGELEERKKKIKENGGLDVVDNIYEYLISDEIHHDRWDHKNRFAE